MTVRCSYEATATVFCRFLPTPSQPPEDRSLPTPVGCSWPWTPPSAANLHSASLGRPRPAASPWRAEWSSSSHTPCSGVHPGPRPLLGTGQALSSPFIGGRRPTKQNRTRSRPSDGHLPFEKAIGSRRPSSAGTAAGPEPVVDADARRHQFLTSRTSARPCRRIPAIIASSRSTHRQPSPRTSRPRQWRLASEAARFEYFRPHCGHARGGGTGGG